MHPVVVNVLWDELSRWELSLSASSSLWNVEPSSLSFVSKQDIFTVVELKPSPDSLTEHPNITGWLFMKPVGKRTFSFLWSSPGQQALSELSLESWEYIIELEGVCTQVNPSGRLSEDAESFSWPESVLSRPLGGSWVLFLLVFVKAVNVEVEFGWRLLLQVLFHYFSPLWALDMVIDHSDSLLVLDFGVLNFLAYVNNFS